MSIKETKIDNEKGNVEYPMRLIFCHPRGAWTQLTDDLVGGFTNMNYCGYSKGVRDLCRVR